MSSNEIVIAWADGTYTFKLRLRDIEELQRVCGAGFADIASRVVAGRPYIRDVYDGIRLALIGGGLSPVRAKELVDTYVDGRALASPGDPSSPLMTAMVIYQAAFVGLEDLGSEDAPVKPWAATITASTSRRATAKVRRSGGRQKKRATSPSMSTRRQSSTTRASRRANPAVQ